MMAKLFFKCWNCHSHEIELPKNKVDKFLDKCSKGKFVCSSCSSKIKLINRSDQTDFSSKAYQCKNNHLIIIGVFGKPGMISITEVDKHENIEGFIEDIPNIKCPRCSLKLKPCDDSKLEYSRFPGLKTTTRLGDYWDKQKTPEPKIGSYDVDHADDNNPFLPKYNKTEFEVRNKERLRKIRKQRNIPLDKTPGKPID